MASPVIEAAPFDSILSFPGEANVAHPAVTELAGSRFHCLLDEQPSFLVPDRLLPADAASDLSRQLIVNPRCWFSRDGPPPPEVEACTPFLGHFSAEYETVWVGDPAMGRLMPFWLGPVFSALLSAARPGEPAPTVLPPHARSVLSFARVLVEPGDEARRGAEWAAAVSRCAPLFKKGYAPLGGLIHPYHLGALRRYYRRLIRKGGLQFDAQCSRRYGVHNESVARFFHRQFRGIVSDIAGEPVKPSYVYFASYQSGAELEKHVDRAQCEFSITLCVDYSPEPVRETPWPLHLDTKEGKLTVFQAIGDALLYRGVELPHYRGRLPDGATSTSIFFHFVRENFPGPLE